MYKRSATTLGHLWPWHPGRCSRALLFITLVLLLSGCSKSQDDARKGNQDQLKEKTPSATASQETKEKGKPPTAATEGEATLTLAPLSENTFGVDLNNKAPVRLVQFTLNGITDAQVRTTSRTQGFVAKFTKDNAKVTILSPTGTAIPPGSGFIVEMSCDAGTATLSEVKIAK